jgi:hypothetical protein
VGASLEQALKNYYPATNLQSPHLQSCGSLQKKINVNHQTDFILVCVCGKGAKISKGLSLKPSLFCDAFFPTEQQQGPLFFCSGKVSNNMLLVWQMHTILLQLHLAVGFGIYCTFSCPFFKKGCCCCCATNDTDAESPTKFRQITKGANARASLDAPFSMKHFSYGLGHRKTPDLSAPHAKQI